MGEENQAKKVEEVKVIETEASNKHVEEKHVSKDDVEEKALVPSSSPSLSGHQDSDTKPDEKAIISLPAPPASEKKLSGGSLDRDVELARVEQEKKLALIKAWEESEKTKAQNKACKKLSDIGSWENTKKASVEAQLRKIEEKLEKKKAEYAEKMKNKVAEVHKLAEEKRAMVEAHKGEELLKAEECAAKYRAMGTTPKKFFACFSS